MSGVDGEVGPRDAARPVVRMDELATLPVFFKLGGKPVVMAGGDEPAVWKAELLAAAGACLKIYAPAPCRAMVALADAASPGSITLLRRPWTPADLAGAALAIGSFEDERGAEAFCLAARAAGVPVNVIDKPAYCDFQFGTIVARSPLVIGISTDGAAPVFGQAIRARIEALLPQNLSRWAKAAKDWRSAVKALDLDFRGRRRFWEAFADLALAAAADPTPADQLFCLAATANETNTLPGRITLVGCGPGNVGSVTLDAVAALQSADVVAYDSDIGEALVRLGRREGEKIALSNDTVQNAARLATLVAEGRHVSWLGLGDPMTARRWADRAEHLRGLGLTPVLVGGVSDTSHPTP